MILVDAGPLVALSDRSDNEHARAVKEIDMLTREPRVVCLTALAEAHFLVEAGHLRRNITDMFDHRAFEIGDAKNTAACLRYCFDWLAKYGDHAPDFTDAWLIALSHESGAPVWTFDSQFDTTWRMLDGSPVPRAPGRRRNQKRRAR